MRRTGSTFSIRDRATRPSTLLAFAFTVLLLVEIGRAHV